MFRDDAPVPLAPKAVEVLLLLIHNRDRVVEKDELLQKIWPGVKVEDNNITVQMTAIRKALGDGENGKRYIVTVSRQGYRFVEDVREISAGEAAQPPQPPAAESGPPAEGPVVSNIAQLPPSGIAARLESPFAGYLWHALAASAMYAGLYALSVVGELAYQFDRYGRSGSLLAGMSFVWAFLTALLALAVDWKRTRQGKSDGLLLSCAIALSSAIALAGILWPFLPAHPVTEANMQTSTAQVAHLKNTTYFLVLALCFFITPYHFALACLKLLQSRRADEVSSIFLRSNKSVLPPGTIYPRMWLLIALLIVFMTYSLYAHPHLFDNLKPSRYMGLFMTVTQIRLALFYALIVECLAWYHFALNEIKRECFAPETSPLMQARE